jgi:N-acetylneuraminic acid mutarotase
VWAGVFFGKVGVVDSDALGVRRISDTGIRAGLQRGTQQAAVVDEMVFLFCTGVGIAFEDTGYVYSAARDSWHPFGIVPEFMAGGHFSTVVYGTWIVFVRMADLAAGPSCFAFDVSRCTWLVMPGILTAREWPCVAVVGDSLYVVGGRGCRDLRVNGGQTVGSVPTERIRLDLCFTQSAQWERVGPSFERFQSSAVVIDGSIYVTGGYYPDPARPGTRLVSSALTRIDPESGTVEEMSSMQCGRCGHSSFVSSDGQIVVLGGAIPQFLNRVSASPAERFDFGKRKWIPFGIPSAESAEYGAW